MSKGQADLARAYSRVAIIKAIVRAERERAEAKPIDDRNIKLGLIEIGQEKSEAADQIAKSFNDIETFLDHLHVAHLAAAFEAAALKRIDAIIGEARKAIKNQRKQKTSWPQNLVRSKENFSGLGDISSVLNLDEEANGVLKSIRTCRNEFSHGTYKQTIPNIGPEDTLTALSAIIMLVV